MELLNSIKKKIFHKKSENDKLRYLIYFNSFSEISDEITYKLLLRNLNEEVDTSQTQKDIQFYNIPLNFTISETLVKLEQPRLFVKHANIQNITSLFYRKKIDNNKATLHYCYYKEKFIFGSLIFDRIDVLFTTETEQAICQKYLGDKITETKITTIIDKNNNMLEIKNSVDFRINFHIGNKDILLQLDSQQTEEQITKLNNVHRELTAFF